MFNIFNSESLWLGTSREAGKFNGQGVPLDLGTLQ